MALPTAKYADNLWVFLDNAEVAARLLSPFAKSSQSVFEASYKAALSWPERDRLPHTLPGSIQVRWVPSHAKVPGNEQADEAAREGACVTPPSSTLYTMNSLKKLAQTRADKSNLDLWKLVAPAAYQNRGPITTPRAPSELKLPRHLLGRILASRTGHGDFAAYHERFNHTDAHMLCRCGKRKAPVHFLFCSIAKRRAPRPPGRPTEILPLLLSTEQGARTLASWLTKTRFYDDICTRYPRDE